MPRAGLTRQGLTEAGARLADAGGIEALTLAALAQQFGVRQPSLYKHVDGLPALRREIRLLALRELNVEVATAAVGRSGSEALLAIAAAYRKYAAQHPGRYAASVAAPPEGDTELHQAAAALLDTIAAVLRGFGLEDDEAIHAIRGLRALLHGFVALESAGGFAMPQDLEESYRRLILGFDASIRLPVGAAPPARRAARRTKAIH